MPTLTATPSFALQPTPVAIRGEGFDPGERITLQSTLTDDAGVRWCAHGVFVADVHGMIDLATARMIHPPGERLEPGRQPILQASLTVPVAGVDEHLSLGVRLVHVGTLASAPRCTLGFSFLALRPRARRIVIGFFGERLRCHRCGGNAFGALSITEARVTVATRVHRAPEGCGFTHLVDAGLAVVNLN